MTANIVTPELESASPLKLSWINIFFFGTFHLFALLAPWHFSWTALGITLLLHWLFGSIGICLAYHRLLTHRSFAVPKWLEYILATVGCMAMQGGPLFWVSGHRQHHLHTEHEYKDPYSAAKGFWWSHMLWLMYPRMEFFNANNYRKYAPDLAREAYYNWLDRYFLLLQLPLAFALYVWGGWSFVVYGVFVRAVLLWHTTWLINSATHMIGDRRFDCPDGSRNLWWAAVLTFGEGWHNNHHAYPNVAKAGWKWWELDITWWVIKTLERVGLAKRVVYPPQDVFAKI